MNEYYKTCAFPKPVDKKKKKKVNGWKGKKDRVCAYCGKPYAQRHEVYGGSNRQTSIDQGFQVDVCEEHHRLLHENCTEWAIKENKRLRQKFQKQKESEYMEAGASPKLAREMWLHMIGRSYL